MVFLSIRNLWRDLDLPKHVMPINILKINFSNLNNTKKIVKEEVIL